MSAITNIADLAVGSLVLNDGAYYTVQESGGVKYLRQLQESELDTYFVDNSWTLSYALDTNSWASYHDYYPSVMVNTRNILFSSDYKKLYRHNVEGKYAKYYEVGSSQATYASYIDAVFNPENVFTKVFSTVNWVSKITNSSGAHLHQETITDLLIYNSYQCSGNLDLTTKTSSNAETLNYNMYNREGTWGVNKFRDLVNNTSNPFIDSELNVISSNINSNKPWYEQKRFIDKFIISRFSFDNVSQNSLYLYDVSANMRLSAR
jgi:hypothetical protein